jgi:hypothetical protein
MVKRWLALGIGAIVVAGVFSGCSSQDSDSQGVRVKVRTRGLGTGSLSPSQVRSILSQSAGIGAKSVDSPDVASGEYDGMGVVSSDAVVESFKIHVTTVAFNTKIPGSSGERTSPVTVDRELDIALGVNTAVEVTGTIDPGTYVSASVGFKPQFKIKAYAYMDTNNDGTIDTTVYTTATGVKKVASKVSMLPTKPGDYAEFTYRFLYLYCSSSATASDPAVANCGTITFLPTPVEITEGASPTVTLVISSLKNVFAWTGDGNDQGFGTTLQQMSDLSKLGDGSTKLAPINFPLDSPPCSGGNNNWGINGCDLWPNGTPAFNVSYLPAFAFLDTTDLESQVYLISTQSGKFGHYNSKAMTLVVKDGVPQVGMISGQLIGAYDFTPTTPASPPAYSGGTNPILGTVARIFEPTSGGEFTFYMDYGDDNNGVEDGGLYYNNDKTMAGFIAEGFSLKSLNGTGSFTVRDGPRCSDEYNYCFASAVNTKLINTGNIPGYSSATGARTYYYKRIQ